MKRIATLVTLTAAIATPAWAQEFRPVDFERRQGSLFASYEDELSGDQTIVYVVQADAGDQVTAGLIGYGVVWDVFAPGSDEPLEAGATNLPFYALDQTGEWTFQARLRDDALRDSGQAFQYTATFAYDDLTG